MKRNLNQQNKDSIGHVMSPAEIIEQLGKIGLNQLELKIRTGLSYSTINGTINLRYDNPTLLSYLEDLGIKHNRPYDKSLARPVIYPKSAQNNENGSQVA